MRSTTELRGVWAPPCTIQRATFSFWTGVAVTVDGRIIPALRQLDRIMKKYGYRPKAGETWGYNCRRITGGSGYSLHAYGIAVDINSRANPYGPRLVTDMPRPMVNEILEICTKGGHQVWGWGGNYRNNKDAMHFECVASPAELAEGIAASPQEELSMADVQAILDRLQKLEDRIFHETGPHETIKAVRAEAKEHRDQIIEAIEK